MRSLRRKRVSLFPKNQRPRNEKTSVRAKKKPKIERAIQSHPIPFNPAAECSGRKAEKEEEENKKRNNFWKVPKTKRYFLIEINLNCFLEKPLGQTQQDKGFNGVERIWSRLQKRIHQIHLRVPTTGTAHQLKINPFERPEANIVMHMPKSVGSYLDGLA